jgi:nucleoside 2-deoxyribosyltransferase
MVGEPKFDSGTAFDVGVLMLFGIGLLVLAFHTSKGEDRSYEKTLAKAKGDYLTWTRTWYCQKCGNVFVV